MYCFLISSTSYLPIYTNYSPKNAPDVILKTLTKIKSMILLNKGVAMILEYYKKIDKSFFDKGITIPNKYVDIFLQGKIIKIGTSKKINIVFNSKSYNATFIFVNRKEANPVYQIRWDQNVDLINILKKEFIQTYFAIKSQEYDSKLVKKYYVTNLLGGNQEVIIFRPIDPDTIELETFIKISTPYDNIFKRFVEENVFGWLSSIKRDYLIVKTTDWLTKNELAYHEDARYVVYYLIDEKKEELYIGSATHLGSRVKVGRAEIPGWNLFKYDIIHPQYHHLLKRIEFHTIGAFASLMKNNGRIKCFSISDFKLVNKNWSKKIN